jgi:anti-sigma B factor antagonist
MLSVNSGKPPERGELQPMSLTIGVDDRDDATVIALDGELDLASAPDLADVAARRLADRTASDVPVNLILDLSKLTFCDSAGLRVFVRYRSELEATGGRFVLAAPQAIVRRVLEVSGLVEFFGCYSTVDEARSALAA